ncbi:hypothetical protein LCP963914a_8489 [Penicillium roqueforti]|nr:hypothetical protein LCP963914a_8489 [Penicillium roqueforti]
MKTNRQTKAFWITLRPQGVSSSLLRLCHNTIIRHRILNSQPNLQLNLASAVTINDNALHQVQDDQNSRGYEVTLRINRHADNILEGLHQPYAPVKYHKFHPRSQMKSYQLIDPEKESHTMKATSALSTKSMQTTERLLNITHGATCASYLPIVWMYAHWRNVFHDREARSGDRLLEQVHLAVDDILGFTKSSSCAGNDVGRRLEELAT